MKQPGSRRPKNGLAALLGLCTAAVLTLVCATPTRAAGNDLPPLLVQKRCNACHATNESLIGPPFVAVALRYGADKDRMTEVLARKILLGGGGSWGVIPMVPNEVSLEEARWMANWVLGLKPSG